MPGPIGFIGVGQMGQPMARNLLKSGFELRVYDKHPEQAAPLVALGAHQAFRLSDVVAAGGIVITMVPDESYGRMIAENRYDPALFPVPLGLKDVDLVLSPVAAVRVPEGRILCVRYVSSNLVEPALGTESASVTSPPSSHP